jgi:hypothetical protein
VSAHAPTAVPPRGALPPLRAILAVSLLSLEVLGVIHARFSPTRWFGWAMFHTYAAYTIEVTLHGEPLTPGEIAQRYRLPAADVERRSIAHTIDIVRRLEETRRATDDARVTLRYREGRGAEQKWRWPER